jgi:hypothetical protein
LEAYKGLAQSHYVQPVMGGAWYAPYEGVTLSAYADANQTVNHFVYQPLSADGSIVAKVQLAVSSSSSAPALSNAEGKAGLMLRQNNEVSSPFVFVYVQNGKVMVEYRPSASSGAATN